MAIAVSVIPILLLFVLMLGVRMPGWKSALVTLCITVLLGLLAMPEVPARGTVIFFSVVEGVLKAVFPILLIILMAIYSYNVVVASGAIDTIKAQFASIADDKGLEVLLIVWGFGGLLEGMAGFGTAVAIPAAMLIGLGYKPMFSAVVALIGNSVNTAFGAVGVPVLTLCNEVAPGGVASADLILNISTATILQLAALYYVVPALIVWLAEKSSFFTLRTFFLVIWVGTVSLAVQYLCALFVGVETPAIIGSLASIGAMMLFSKISSKRKKDDSSKDQCVISEEEGSRVKGGKNFWKAWSVYLLILLLILVTGPMMPGLERVLKDSAVMRISLPAVGSSIVFSWLGNAALWILIGSVGGGLIQGLKFGRLMRILCHTLMGLGKTTITIVSLIAMASVMNHTGMISTIATGLAAVTGEWYPYFAPFVGAIGTFVTGSDTSSNILFGKLQASVATGLGLSGKEAVWLEASNTVGATAGKMISPQSIAIATAACDMKEKDDLILRRTIPYSLLYLLICAFSAAI